jgi:hypothetical protein
VAMHLVVTNFPNFWPDYCILICIHVGSWQSQPSGMGTLHCHLCSRWWWSDTLWVALSQLWLQSLCDHILFWVFLETVSCKAFFWECFSKKLMMNAPALIFIFIICVSVPY